MTMRRLWAVGAAVLACLALVRAPATAHEAAIVTVWGTISDCVQSAPGTSLPWGDDDGVVVRDMVVSCTVVEAVRQGGSASDPVVSGTVTERIDYAKPTGPFVLLTPWLMADAVSWGTTEIRGPDGGWVGTWARNGGVACTLVAQGTGAYAGWTLVASMPATAPPLRVQDVVDRPAIGGDLYGVIYQGPPPPFGPLPAPPSE
jgi:hypothetical protein